MDKIREIKEDEIVDVAVLNDNFSALERKKADRTTQHPVTLLATSWTGESSPYTCTIKLEEITADNTITLVPAEDITAEQYTALQSAQIADAEQTAGTLTLQAKNKPAIDIPILVLIGDTSIPSTGGGATIPLINHLLTENAGVGALDAYQGMILDGKIACLSNPNLLINPDFRINQRNITSWNDGTYGVDRWRGGNGLITVIDNGLILSKSFSEKAGTCIEQLIENPKRYEGKMVTLSASINGNIISTSGIIKLAKKTSDIASSFSYYSVKNNCVLDIVSVFQDNIPTMQVRVWKFANDMDITINWVKMELGEKTTPFVPPDPATELLKCQRYYQRIPTNGKQVYRSSDGRLFVNFQFGMEMRTTPTIKNLPMTLQIFDVVDNIVLREENWYNSHYSNSKGVSFLSISFSELETTGTGVIGYLDNNADFLEADAEIY